MSKGSADTRSPNWKARAETWERVFGRKGKDNALEAWKTRLAEDNDKYTLEEAFKRAGEPVMIFPSDETGELQWVVSLEDSFWMDAFPTEAEAREFVEVIGWPVIE